METTDLYEAAESLLMPEQAEEPNQVEDQAEDADIVDDDQDDGSEDDLGDVDDAETSDSEDDASDDDVEEEETAEVSDEDDEASEPATYPVTVDGQVEQWTIEQLQQSASGQAAIRKRMEEAAALRREVEERASQLEQQQAEILKAYQTLRSGENIAPPKPPSKDLLAKDPIGYLEAEVAYKEQMEAYQQNAVRLQAMEQQRQQREQAEFMAKRDEAAKRLGERIPEYANPETREAFAKSIIKAAEAYGFNQDEMIGLMDDRYVLALNDARKYRELMAKRQNAEAKVKKAPAKQPIKAGAKKVSEPASKARKQAQERLKRTGSIDDAISLIFNS